MFHLQLFCDFLVRFVLNYYFCKINNTPKNQKQYL